MRILRPVLVACIALSGCSVSLGEADIGDGTFTSPAKRPQSAELEAGAEPPPEEPPPEEPPPPPAKRGPVDASAPETKPITFPVFVTSKQTTGNIGGLTGADAFCNAAAKEAGLAGTFRAWISTPTTNAIDRITAPGPFVLSNGKAIANTKTGLTSGTLLEELDKDEKGNTPPIEDNRAWTATGPDGKYKGYDCGQWTTTGGEGRTGEAEYEDGRWTDSKVEYCDKLKRLYCFAQ